MAEAFKRPGKLDFTPAKQEEIRGAFRPETNKSESTTDISRAAALVAEYNETIEFAKWLEGLLDEDFKDIVVQIDPEEDPQVWMAMQRIFSNPNPKISYQAYTQVLAAIEQVENLEAEVNNEFKEEEEFIKEMATRQEALEKVSSTSEMNINNEGEIIDPTVIRTIPGV